MRLTARSRHALLAGIFAFATPLCSSLAADTSDGPADAVSQAPVTPAPVIVAPVKLPYGVEDVLKLSRAQIGENIILNYIQSSGTIYNLGPKDIVYLRDQGVSDTVINAMLDQRKRAELASQAAAAAAAQAGAAAAPMVAEASPAAAPTTTDQPVTYAEAPLTPPASSVYVIPYSGSYYAPYYPYYGPAYYGGWYGPSIAFGFRFGGHGGFHGGHGSFGGHGGGHGSFGGHHR